jgi:hypothetical protein
MSKLAFPGGKQSGYRVIEMDSDTHPPQNCKSLCTLQTTDPLVDQESRQAAPNRGAGLVRTRIVRRMEIE